MAASLKFESDSGKTAADLSQVKIITLEDGSSNQYSLKIEGQGTDAKLILGYKASGSAVVKEHTVTGLVPSITNLLTANSGDRDNGRDITVLEKEAANKDVVKAVLGAQDGKKSILVEELGKALDRDANDNNDKVYGNTGHEKIAKDFLADKYPLAKIDASNLTDAANRKAFAEKILGATKKDANNKDMSILAKKLGGFLASPDTAKYDDTLGATAQTAKAFLESKGLMPSVDAVAVLPALQSGVAIKLLDDTNKTKLGQAILGVKKEVDGIQKPALETNLAANTDLQTAVAGNDTLKTAIAKPADIAAIPVLQTAVAGNTDLREAVAKNTDLQTAVAGNTGLREAVAKNTDLQTAVAADPGLKQAVTNSGIAANEDVQKAVATKLLDNANKTKLGQAILDVKKEVDGTQKPALETNLAANSDLQAAVKGALADDATFQGAVKIEVNAEEPGFQGAVRDIMSKPVFEIPTDDTAPLSWDW